MAIENGEWIMYGLREDDPACIHSAEELIAFVDEVGFLPLFKNAAAGFSVEEHTVPEYWWSEDPVRDPWLWRQQIAAGGRLAYGKLFDKKAGFLSLKWLPKFVNFRRDGYDFDSLWEDELASMRQKKIMDCFTEQAPEHFSYALKKLAGFGKGGEKNFEGVVTGLQERTYLCIRDFRCRRNKAGQPYGWPIAVYTVPEAVWGYDNVTSAYCEQPAQSAAEILLFAREKFPQAEENALRKLLGISKAENTGRG